MNYELLIERARAAAKETVCFVEPRIMNQLADALENQEHFIKGLQEIIKQQGGVTLRAADLALELDKVKAELLDERDRFDRLSDFEVAEAKELSHTKKLLELAQEERDVVTKRMILLAIEQSHALADFKASLLGDPCDFCANKFEDDGRCYESDIDCEKCRHDDCTCKGCRDFDRWVWRGVKQATASNSQVTEPLQPKASGGSEELCESCEQVKKERDALLQELRGMCDKCVHYHNGWGDSACHGCEDQNWEWNDQKEE